MIRPLRLPLILALALGLVLARPALPADRGDHWVASWGASPFAFRSFGPAEPPEALQDLTIREKMRLSVGGTQLMIRLSNELGTMPLAIGAVTVALAGEGAAIDTASLRTVTFGGETSITIPAGAPAESDPVDLAVDDLAELAVSIYLPGEALPRTLHMGRTSYTGTGGDTTRAADMPAAELGTNMMFLTGVYVRTPDAVSVIAALGDSITDGTASTPHAYGSWPDQLAIRSAGRDIAIVNEGIAGNQVLSDGAGSSALGRFERDVLSLPGLTHIILLEGINDIGAGGMDFFSGDGATPPVRSAADIIAGYRQLITRAHARGIKIYGATLTPFEGALAGYYTPEKDDVRRRVNDWIRNAGEFDGVVDFEAAVRDPANPGVMKPAYNSGDNLHPGDAGYRAMADSVDLTMFR